MCNKNKCTLTLDIYVLFTEFVSELLSVSMLFSLAQVAHNVRSCKCYVFQWRLHWASILYTQTVADATVVYIYSVQSSIANNSQQFDDL